MYCINHFSGRYQRQMALPEVGVAGQQALARARVLLVGAGGLGSPAALYLAAAGVGCLGIVDDDVVALSNLHRQVLHGTSAIGKSKTDSAGERLHDLNPDVRVVRHPVRISPENAMALIAAYDLVVDGSDNFATRYLVNDACVLAGKPFVYGTVSRFEGQVSVFNFHASGCYRCLYPQAPVRGVAPSCADGGVLGVLPGIIGTMQAAEAIKIMLGAGETLAQRLLLVDGWSMRFRELHFSRDVNCAVCGDRPSITSITTNNPEYANEPGATAMSEITPIQLKERIDRGDSVVLVDVREPHELAICALPGALAVPLGQIVARAGEIDARHEVVVFCRSGVRSAKAIADLQQNGYRGRLMNLKGGILAWADDVDPSITKY